MQDVTPISQGGNAQGGNATRGPLAYAALGLSLIALGVAGYLSVQSIVGNPIAGCGSGAGCAEVLASPWAKVVGVPVSLLGAAAYSLIAALLLLRVLRRKTCWACDALLLACATSMIAAAGWFIYLQKFELDAICKYCMADHGLGVVLAVLLIAIVVQGKTCPFGKMAIPLAVGLLGVVAIARLQIAFPSVDPEGIESKLPDHDFDLIVDGQRQIGIFGGEVKLTLDDELYKGDRDAPHVIALAFDYCCPHCRGMHQFMDEVQQERGDFVILALPISINPQHNEFINDDSDRFKESYELALLALAVASVDREKWVAFDRWLFSYETVTTFERTYDEAYARAKELVGHAALQAAMDPENMAAYRAQINRNIEMLKHTQGERTGIPVTTAPGASEHRIERFYEASEIDALIEESTTRLNSPAELE